MMMMMVVVMMMMMVVVVMMMMMVVVVMMMVVVVVVMMMMMLMLFDDDDDDVDALLLFPYLFLKVFLDVRLPVVLLDAFGFLGQSLVFIAQDVDYAGGFGWGPVVP